MKNALLIRGGMPTSVTVVCDKGCWQAAAQVPEALRYAAAGVTALVLQCPDSSKPKARASMTALLQSLAEALPSLQSLTLDNYRCALPTPVNLPSLRHFSATDSASYSSIAPLLPQLTGLVLGKPNNPVPWHEVLTSAYVSHTLTRIDAPATTLTDQLLGLFMAYTPVLSELSVRDMSAMLADHSSVDWALTTLRCVGTRSTWPHVRECPSRVWDR